MKEHLLFARVKTNDKDKSSPIKIWDMRSASRCEDRHFAEVRYPRIREAVVPGAFGKFNGYAAPFLAGGRVFSFLNNGLHATEKIMSRLRSNDDGQDGKLKVCSLDAGGGGLTPSSSANENPHRAPTSGVPSQGLCSNGNLLHSVWDKSLFSFDIRNLKTPVRILDIQNFRNVERMRCDGTRVTFAANSSRGSKMCFLAIPHSRCAGKIDWHGQLVNEWVDNYCPIHGEDWECRCFPPFVANPIAANEFDVKGDLLVACEDESVSVYNLANHEKDGPGNLLKRIRAANKRERENQKMADIATRMAAARVLEMSRMTQIGEQKGNGEEEEEEEAARTRKILERKQEKLDKMNRDRSKARKSGKQKIADRATKYRN
jgi:hypothetical protein